MSGGLKEDKYNSVEIGEIKTQLRSIRDQVNKLLDTLDIGKEAGNKTDKSKHFKNDGIGLIFSSFFLGDSNALKSDISTNDDSANKVNPTEFDPLQDKGKHEAKKESQKSEASNSQPPSLSATPGPAVQQGVPNPNKQGHVGEFGEYYGVNYSELLRNIIY